MTVTDHQFSINNRNIHYLEAGLHHGRTLLLLHGGIGDAYHNWGHMIPVLAEEYHVLAPDLPGFGDSESLAGNARLSDLITWVLDFLQSQDVEHVVIIGSSFGALVARLLAVQYPQIIAAVILVNGGFVPDIPIIAKILMKIPLVGQIVVNFLAKLATSDDSLQEMIHHSEALTPDLIANAQANTSGFANLMRMTATQSLPGQVKPLVAILILWGVEDGSTTLSEGKKLSDILVGADFVEIQDCGHLPHLEEPDIFEWQVKNFLAKRDPVKRATIPGT